MIVIHREQKRKQLLNFATSVDILEKYYCYAMVQKTSKHLYESDLTVLLKRHWEVQNVF